MAALLRFCGYWIVAKSEHMVGLRFLQLSLFVNNVIFFSLCVVSHHGLVLGLTSNGNNSTKYNLDYRFSSWSDFTPCTRSCGIGVTFRRRTCFRFGHVPIPVNGSHCKGITHDYRACNTQPCPPGSRDFRHLQCSFFNGQVYKSRSYHWVPLRSGTDFPKKYRKVDPCALICSPVGLAGWAVKFSKQVVDGTVCSRRPAGVCVAGRCQHLGCDLQLGSNTTKDWCGVCGGNNSTCTRISSIVDRLVAPGYSELIRIPEKSRHIKVLEKSNSHVTLDVKDAAGTVHINGNQPSRYSTVTKFIAGSLFYYQHRLYGVEGLESIHADGPITEAISIVGFSKHFGAVVNIFYEYASPRPERRPRLHKDKAFQSMRSFPWQALLYAQVVAGHRLPRPSDRFYSNSRGSFVKSSTDLQKNLDKYRSISPHEKKVSSRIIPKSNHRTKATKTQPYLYGYKNYNTRHMILTRNATNYIHIHTQLKVKPFYKHVEKNATIKNMHQISERYKNEPKMDTTADLNITELKRTTDVSVDSYRPIEEDMPLFIPDGGRFTIYQDLLMKPKRTRYKELERSGKVHMRRHNQGSTRNEDFLGEADLNRHKSIASEREQNRNRSSRIPPDSGRYRWRTNSITPCSKTCSAGVQISFFVCMNEFGKEVDDSFCNVDSRPDPSHHICTRRNCDARWVAGLWSKCSRTCDDGVQARTVHCWQMMAPGFDSTVHDIRCPKEKKPKHSRKCNDRSCGPQWETSEWSECSVHCGSGFRSRQVRCNAGRDDICERTTKPLHRMYCPSEPCINHWNSTSRTKCSGKCGVGFQYLTITCKNQRVTMDDSFCDRNSKPLGVHSCGEKRYCQNVWVPQNWDKCSAMCGYGISTRKVVCGAVLRGNFRVQPDTSCHHMKRPVSSIRCRQKLCPPHWYTTQWSKCSKTCGRNAVRLREAKCYYDNKLSNNCAADLKPLTSETCQLPICPDDETDETCRDNQVSNCDLVHTSKLCDHWYYHQACCHTCKRLTGRSPADKTET